MEDSRVLGLDFGERRIGVAVSDPLGMLAHTRPFIENNKKTMSKLMTLVEEEVIDKIVLGLPKNLKGEDTASTLKAKAFGEAIQKAIKLDLIYWDERFSTKAAQKQFIAMGIKSKKTKDKIDSQAAAFILQGYLDSRS